MTHLASGTSVTATDLAVRFADFAALNTVNLTITEGEFTGIIGPNGCGKSTLLRTVSTLQKPSDGTVFIGRDDARRIPRRELARYLALVSQTSVSEVDLTVIDVVLLGRIPHQGAWQSTTDTDRVIAEYHLEQVGMADFASRSWHTLSGGEQQRVQLARAFAQEPSLLLLDEPTNHLDIAHALRLLAAVQHSGVTVVAALHDLNLAAAFCDRLIVMSHGRVVAAGPPGEVLTPVLLREVYDVDARVGADPETGRPHITFYPPAVDHD